MVKTGTEDEKETTGWSGARPVMLQIKERGGFPCYQDNVPDQAQLRREGSPVTAKQPTLPGGVHHYNPKKTAFHLRSHRRRGLLGGLGLVLNDSGLRREEMTTFSILFQRGTTASFTPPLPRQKVYSQQGDSWAQPSSRKPGLCSCFCVQFGFYFTDMASHHVLKLALVG